MEDAIPILVDGLRRNVGVVTFPTTAYLVAYLWGSLHPITLCVLGPFIGTGRVFRKISTRLLAGAAGRTRKEK